MFVGIYAHRYGVVPQGAESSLTEMEFDRAKVLGRPMFCFVVDDDHPWPPKYVDSEPGRTRLSRFKDYIRRCNVVDTFSTPDNLASKVAAALGRYLMQQMVKSGLAQAGKGLVSVPEGPLDQVSRRAARLSEIISGARILLVNDVPADMADVILVLRGLGIEVEVAEESSLALAMLTSGGFDAVVSDMARGGVNDEGMRFLEAMRHRGFHHPTVFTVGQYEPCRGTPAYAFGITNRVDHLLNYVFDILERVRG